jgi:hypothetical protein
MIKVNYIRRVGEINKTDAADEHLDWATPIRTNEEARVAHLFWPALPRA